jgi:glycosyltransferase involved in cell wall biosynthesis
MAAQPLSIALDIGWLGTEGAEGIRHWTRSIFEALIRDNPWHRFTLVWPYPSAPDPRVFEALAAPNVTTFALRPPALWRRVARKLGLVNDPVRAARRLRSSDVIHWNALSEGCFRWLHLIPEVPKVVTLYDATVATVPECHTPEVVQVWRNHFARVRELGSWWLAISAATRDDMERYGGLDPDLGRTIYPGHNYAARGETLAATGPPAKLGLSGAPYLLTVGTIEPRKNQARLIRAFRRLVAQPRFAGWKLVLVGRDGWKSTDVLREMGTTPAVIWAGRLTHDELAAAYQHAAVFAYPSLYEGFGLPVAEAMSFGLPVVTSKGSSLPEVAGPAGILVDPLDEGEIQAALERLMADPGERRCRGELGRDYARRFNWPDSAREVMKLLEKAAASKQRVPVGLPTAETRRVLSRR